MNKCVAFYTFEDIDTRQCNECGALFHAFEFDSNVNTFKYTTKAHFVDANVIRDMTSSIGGPMAYPIHSGTIIGQKNGSNSWLIQFDLPAYSLNFYSGFKKIAVFIVK